MAGAQERPKLGDSPPIAWSVEGFGRFWAQPQLSLVPRIVTPDVAGYWPRTRGPVRGPADYTRAIAALLSIMPDFRAEVVEHAINADRIFVRWRATATPPIGHRRIEGVDRVLLRGGLVAENRIYSDHPVFDLLAARLRPLAEA